MSDNPGADGAGLNGQHRAPSLLAATCFGLCPCCGQRTLFSGIIRFAPRCVHCGLDIAGFNVGDGPAAFLTLIVGALACGVAAWLALGVDPPWWVYALVLVPLTLGLILAGLRAGKAALLASEYARAAGEGRKIDR